MIRDMDGIEYRLYVPAEGSRTFIDAGSAIVGGPQGELISVHYEKGGPDNIRTFEDRITHAAGRRAQDYPTTARSCHPASELVDVGSVRFDGLMRRWVLASIDDAAALEAWSPGTHVVGGSSELKEHAAGMLYSRLSSSGIVDVAMASGTGTPMVDAVFAAAARPGRLR